MKNTAQNIISTRDADPTDVFPYPRVVVETKFGHIVVAFQGAELVSVSSVSSIGIDPEGFGATPYVTINGVDYRANVWLRPHGYGDAPEHSWHYLGWRASRQHERGWLDRECGTNLKRAVGSLDPSDSAREKFRNLAENVVAELIESRPALSDLGTAAELRGKIENKEARVRDMLADLKETEAELTSLRLQLKGLS